MMTTGRMLSKNVERFNVFQLVKAQNREGTFNGAESTFFVHLMGSGRCLSVPESPSLIKQNKLQTATFLLCVNLH